MLGSRATPAPLALAAALAGAAALALVALAADAPSEVRRRKGDLVVVEKKSIAAAEEALPLAAELARAGPDLYATLFARGWDTGSGIRAVTVDGAGKTARAIAGRTILRGEGLPVGGTRFLDLEYARAKQAGERVPGTVRDFYEQRLQLFARATGLPAVPRDLRLVAAVTAPDGRIRADALGFQLLTAVRLAAALAPARRLEGSTTYIGATADAGFEGLLCLYVASAELQTLKSHFTYDGKALVEASLIDYDPYATPRWFPHELRLTRPADDPGPPALEVKDGKSRLLDEAAILLATCEFIRLKDAQPGPDAAPVFGQLRGAGDVKEDLFPASLATGAREIARFVFRNLGALHFVPSQGAFVSEARPGEKGARVDTAGAGLALVALEALMEAFPEDAKLRGEAKKLLQAQAGFLLARQGPDGAIAAAFDLEKPAAGAAPATATATLRAEGLAIEGLLAAARATGEERYQAAATKLAHAVEERRYDPWVSLYLADDPAAEATITPDDAGHILGALRELGLTAKAPEAIDRLRDVYLALAKAGGLGTGAEVATLRLKVTRAP